MRRPSSTGARKRLSVIAVIGALTLLFAGCNTPTFGESHGASTQGHDIAKLYSGMFITGLAVAIFVWALIFWCIVRYRRSKRDDSIPRQFQDKPILELVYTIIPLIIVIVIFAFTVGTENRVNALSTNAPVNVKITAYQWGWIFQYEKSGVTVQTPRAASPNSAPGGYDSSVYPQLVLPEGETAQFTLISDDVIHDFYVHAFNFDRFAQPGVHNQFDITPTRLGVYPAQCSEYCGLYHSQMLFSVAVVTPSTFSAWLAHAKAHPNQSPAHFGPINSVDQHI